MLKTLKNFELKGKTVLLRCDFNVPLNKKNQIEDDFRIKQTIPTIEYLVEKKAKIILLSHLGKPQGKIVENLRLDPVQKKLADILGLKIKKTADCIGKKTEKEVRKIKEGEILLLENLRFHRGEEENDCQFAKDLAGLGDFYINDAFGASHRAHASIARLPKILPSAAGFLLEKEIKVLSAVLNNPWRPLVAVIGGAKIEDKIKVIKFFLKQADHLLVGGKIANVVLAVKGICVGQPLPSEEILEETENIDLTSVKIHLPIDAIASPDDKRSFYTRESAPAKVRKDEKLLDIGPETINIFSKIIKEAKMIVWSGPLGFFENRLFEKGTKEIAEAISKNHKAFKIAGGGDTLSALNKFGLRERFDHVSTGGGAMLDFLSGKELPGLEVLD